MTDLEVLAAELEAEFEELRFPRFGFDEAWTLGSDLVEAGRRDSLSVAVGISAYGQTLFHAALPGTTPDNDQWLLRKSRVVLRFHRSSLAVATRMKLKATTLEDKYGLSSADFAPYGGSVPIFIQGAGVVGSVTVSGLADTEDHRMAADAMRRLLARLG